MPFLLPIAALITGDLRVAAIAAMIAALCSVLMFRAGLLLVEDQIVIRGITGQRVVDVADVSYVRLVVHPMSLPYRAGRPAATLEIETRDGQRLPVRVVGAWGEWFADPDGDPWAAVEPFGGAVLLDLQRELWRRGVATQP
jgi:hypothetical protein